MDPTIWMRSFLVLRHQWQLQALPGVRDRVFSILDGRNDPTVTECTVELLVCNLFSNLEVFFFAVSRLQSIS
jgi:hypothetical protein